MGGVVAVQGANAASPLPAVTAQQLLVDVQTAKPTPLSGTISESVDLGLPTLPSSVTGGSDSASTTSLLTGDHTLRVWTDGAQRSRLALMAEANETNIVRNGDQVWQWSSNSRTASHLVLTKPARSAAGMPGADATQVPRTPQEAATWALAKLDPSTKVTTTGTSTVAGRGAYELVLTPRSSTSRVASVHLAIDAKTRVPLRVQVFSTKTDAAAVNVGFTQVSFAKPAASIFNFTPPPGATVVQHSPSAKPAHRSASAAGSAAKPTSTTTGTGWTEVVSGRLPAQATTAAAGAARHASSTTPQDLIKLFPSASGSWGTGHVLDGTLISVVVTSDGRYAAGAVAPSALYAALPPA